MVLCQASQLPKYKVLWSRVIEQSLLVYKIVYNCTADRFVIKELRYLNKQGCVCARAHAHVCV